MNFFGTISQNTLIQITHAHIILFVLAIIVVTSHAFQILINYSLCFHLLLLAQVTSRLSVHLLIVLLCFFVILIVHHAMHCKAIITITITITYCTKSRPQPFGINSMVDAMPPVLLCSLFQVHSKHFNRAVTLIQQSCMSSCHIAICYNKKLNKLVHFKKC